MIQFCDKTKNLICSKEFHFLKKHIFINFNFIGFKDHFNVAKGFERYISKDHKVHIYAAIDDFIDESLYDFISKCKYATDKVVTIHISKRDKFLKDKINELLKDLDNWQLIIEKQVMVTPYLYSPDYNDRTYLIVYYYYKDKSERIRTSFHHGKI